MLPVYIPLVEPRRGSATFLFPLSSISLLYTSYSNSNPGIIAWPVIFHQFSFSLMIIKPIVNYVHISLQVNHFNVDLGSFLKASLRHSTPEV